MTDRHAPDESFAHEPSTDDLLQRYITGELSAEEGEILYRCLKDSPEHTSFLFRQMETDVMLEEVVGEETLLHRREMENGSGEPVVSSFATSGPSPFSRTGTLRPNGFFRASGVRILLSACLLFFFLSISFWMFDGFKSDTGAEHSSHSSIGKLPSQVKTSPAPESVATQSGEMQELTTTAVAFVSASVDAVWSERSGFFRQGQAIEPGWLRLRSGLISLEFFNGAEVVIAGPAELEVVAVDRIRCRFGNINVSVPPQAQGFLVVSPQMSVKDLGTAFAVSVSHRGTEVHVIKGEIELHDVPFGRENLREGEAMFVASQGTYQRFEANDDVFAPARSLKDKTKEYLLLQYEKWKARRTRFDNDSALLFRFDFEDLEPGAESVRNAVSGNRAATSDGRIVGSRPAEGRWPGKGAVEFSRTSDRIRIKVPESLESLTCSAWIRVNALNRRSNALLITQRNRNDSSSAAPLEWSILESGSLRLELDSPLPDEALRYDSPICFTPDQLGQWTHVAVVVDGLTQTVSHFVNGMLIGSPHVDKPFKESLPIALGMAEIGNAPAVSNGKGSPIRNFSGCIDEFHFFTRSLSREEVWDLYDPVPDWMTSAD